MNKLNNRVAIVTGSGQGIGRVIALALAKEGAKIITNSRKLGSEGGDAETTANEIKEERGQAVPFFADISSFAACEKLVQAAVDNFGRLDILINNGGTDISHMVWNMTEEEWDVCVDSFLKGSFNCIHFASRLMREQRWGRILNATSIAWTGTVGHCNYGAAKAGVVGLTRSIARELGRYGVTCNAYAPRAATRMTIGKEKVAGFIKRYEKGLTSKERFEQQMNFPPAETVGPMIAYLCTEEAANVNGQVFDIIGNDISLFSEPVKTNTINKDRNSLWTVEELIVSAPKLLEGYVNPAPIQPPEK